jgi:hypothetical protein
MAYVALGSVDEELVSLFETVMTKTYKRSLDRPFRGGLGAAISERRPLSHRQRRVPLILRLIRSGDGVALDWNVYCGPPLADGPVPGWRRIPCDIPALAGLLHRSGEPVVFLTGRAEVGPRALGSRSILCSAVKPGTKDRLNGIKKRDVHLDGSGRLQTIRPDQNPVVAELLTECHRASGIPLLCNSSANHKAPTFP